MHCVSAYAVDTADIAYFETHVRPLLVQHCYECHSADSDQLKGGLRLDYREGILAGGDSGPAVIPGRVGKSLMIQAIRHSDPELQMPPRKKQTLSPSSSPQPAGALLVMHSEGLKLHISTQNKTGCAAQPLPQSRVYP